jgi:hypothetical protein
VDDDDDDDDGGRMTLVRTNFLHSEQVKRLVDGQWK